MQCRHRKQPLLAAKIWASWLTRNIHGSRARWSQRSAPAAASQQPNLSLRQVSHSLRMAGLVHRRSRDRNRSPSHSTHTKMSLADVLSLDGLHHALSQVVQDRVLKLRRVNKATKEALGSNKCLVINVRVNNAGMESIKDLLQEWKGSVNLECTPPWKIGSKFFNVLRYLFESDRLRQLNLLTLSVKGANLKPLCEALVGMAPAIRKLRIVYRGITTDFLAATAPLTSICCDLTMDISLRGNDDDEGSQASACLQHLHASSIGLDSISLRSNKRFTIFNVPMLCATFLTSLVDGLTQNLANAAAAGTASASLVAPPSPPS
jgi:hypothetical protein